MRRALVLLIIFFGVGTAAADDAAVKKYRNFTPAQLAKLPEDRQKSEVPMMYLFAARRALSPGSELLFAMELNRLMYAGVHNLPAAIKAFQTDLGDPATGELTVWQIHQLQQRSEMQSLSEVLFPDRFSSHISDEFATVEGTMIIVDDKIAWPVNYTRVKCFKSSGECEISQIYLQVPDDQSWTQSYQLLVGETDYYSIARWGKDSIESHPLGGSDDCRNTSISFNFKTKEFYFITRNAGGDCKVLSAELQKLAKPRISQIIDGSDVIQTAFSSLKKKAFGVLSSEFRKKIDALDANSK